MKKTRTVIPKKIRAELEADPRRFVCSFKGVEGHECGGRITREHAMYYAGKKIQEKWAIVFICAKGHGVDEYQDTIFQIPKEMRQWAALNQATDEELKKFPRAFPSFPFQKKYLNDKYGAYIAREVPKDLPTIND